MSSRADLLTIPSELRLSIDEYLLGHVTITKLNQDLHGPPIMETCRLICRESVEVYIKRLFELSAELHQKADDLDGGFVNMRQGVMKAWCRREMCEAVADSVAFDRKMGQITWSLRAILEV